MGRSRPQFRTGQNSQTTMVSRGGIILLALVGMLLPSGGFGAEVETLVDRVVAVVNRVPILYSEVAAKVKSGHLVAVSEYPADENASDYEKALQDSINFQLIKQKAREFEIEVSDADVDAEIKRFLDSRQLTMDGLKDSLKQQNMTFEEYRADFKDLIVLRKFQGRVISPLIKVTDKDVETYYLKKSGTTADSVRMTLRQILISIPEAANPDVVEGKQNIARTVHQKLTGGMPFTEAVKVYSDDPQARTNGGLMQEVKLKDLMTNIRTEVEPLEVGQFTAPLRSPLGFHIFYLEAKKFAGSDDFVKQKAQLENELRLVELNSQTKKWLSEQRRKSKVDIVK